VLAKKTRPIRDAVVKSGGNILKGASLQLGPSQHDPLKMPSPNAVVRDGNDFSKIGQSFNLH